MDTNTNSTPKKSNSVSKIIVIFAKPFLNISKVILKVENTTKECVVTKPVTLSIKALKRYEEKLNNKSKINF